MWSVLWPCGKSAVLSCPVLSCGAGSKDRGSRPLKYDPCELQCRQKLVNRTVWSDGGRGCQRLSLLVSCLVVGQNQGKEGKERDEGRGTWKDRRPLLLQGQGLKGQKVYEERDKPTSR